MTFYVPPHFAAQDQHAIFELIARHPFATLISVADEEPVVTHLPLLLSADGMLLGHVAKANPHAALLAEDAQVTAIFHGPHAYVSPTWYEQPGVPTWNYAAVHVRARVHTREGEAAQSLLDTMIDAFDHDPLGEAGTRHMRADERAPMLAQIHCFALEILRIDGKFKLSQNKTLADRQHVISALGQQEDPEAQAVAGMMLSALAPPV